MAKKIYVGINDVAQEASKMYVGVNGVARKVNKAYVGVNNVARECYSASSLPKIVTWADGTDAEIVAMVQAADEGLINLADYWHVGDKRTVHLSAMRATGVSESHKAQDIVLVLSHQGGKTLTTPTASGRTECSFQFDMKDGLYERGYMNSSNTNVGGWTSCDRRTWCNNVFKEALPSTLFPIFKQHKNLTSAGNKSSVIDTTDDWFALRSEIEVHGDTGYSVPGEGSQVDYYKTKNNRIKYSNNNKYNWWERSPSSSYDSFFCDADPSGYETASRATNSLGLSICGCI